MSEEMSSLVSAVSAPGTTYGAAQTASLPPTEWLTYTRRRYVHVAHSVPVESRSRTSVSLLAAFIVAGKPGSSA
jgi:hypothetical protein